MEKSIEFAVAKLNNDLTKVRSFRTLKNAIVDYLESVFHQHISGDLPEHPAYIDYFDTIIEISFSDIDSIVIKRHNNKVQYIWVMCQVDMGSPNSYYNYSDDFFNSADCDEYVGNALWGLLETLDDNNGIIKYNANLLKSYLK